MIRALSSTIALIEEMYKRLKTKEDKSIDWRLDYGKDVE